MMSYPTYGGPAPSRNTVIGGASSSAAPPPYASSSPSSATPPASTASSSASRNCLLKIPNAKASRYVDGSSWAFMALGELAVYKIQVASAEDAVASLAAKEERAASSSRNGLFSPTSALSPSDTGSRKLPPPPSGGFVGSANTSDYGPPPLAKNRSREGPAKVPPPITAPRPIASASADPPLLVERVPSPIVSKPSVPAPHLSLDTSPSAVRTGYTGPSSAAYPRTASPITALPGSAESSILFVVRTTEFPLSASSSITFEEPNNYIIDNGVGLCVRIELELPRNGSHSILDNIIRRHTACGVGSLAPTSSVAASADNSAASSPELRPQDFRSQLLLIDETTGKVLGPLNQRIDINEAQLVSAGERPGQVSSQDPVLVQFPTELDGSQAQGGDIKVSPFSDLTSQYGRNNSKIVGAAEYVSRGILFAAEMAGNQVQGAAAGYKKRTKATDSPLVFSPTTKKAVGSVAGTVEGAAGYARRGIGMIGNAAEKAGATAVSYASKGAQELGLSSPSSANDPNSNSSRVKGLFKDGMQAVLTVVDGVEKGGKHLLETSRQTTNDVVQHRFGDEARDLTNQITGIGSNVVLVYVDARGVMHRALLKRMGKGAIRARMKDGREVVLDDAGLQGTHTERDEKGNLILVDEKQGDRMQIESIEKLDLNNAGQTLSPVQNGQRRPSTPASWFKAPVGLTSALEQVPAALTQVHNELRARPPPITAPKPTQMSNNNNK